MIFSIQGIDWKTKIIFYTLIFFYFNIDMFNFMNKECMNECINTKYELFVILNNSINLDESYFFILL